ncbi:hypothetical protein MNAB215_2401 [Mycobacterium numidiamassiliense]|uniref:Transmembrane protein n=1 Tax=Mycobacterium numidiamassiliense TaxID=1841861 RepID=A0A2U3P946_9MYCO|nr:hypothetical protein [Mycobacterium numidiamassiliense]SPM40205.1 hypothetical protein MNAB215_2401 [Mycobacterium numidiamassiliense]
MTACRRCGLEAHTSRGSWADRHPIAAVLFALPAGYTVVGVLLAYPWFFVPVLIVVCAVVVDRRQRQRHAIAARADFEHRRQIAKAVFQQRTLPPVRRRRAADHWSTTEPVRGTN